MNKRIPINPDLKSLIAARVAAMPTDAACNPKLRAFTALTELEAEVKYQLHQEGIEQKAAGVTFRELGEVRNITKGAAAHHYGNQETRLRRIERTRRVNAEQRAPKKALPGISVRQAAKLEKITEQSVYRRIQKGKGGYEIQEVTVGARQLKRIMNEELIAAVKAA